MSWRDTAKSSNAQGAADAAKIKSDRFRRRRVPRPAGGWTFAPTRTAAPLEITIVDIRSG